MKANTVGAADNNVRWWYSGSDILEGASGWIQFSSLSDLPPPLTGAVILFVALSYTVGVGCFAVPS